MNIFKQIYKKSKLSKEKVLLDQNYSYFDLYLLTNEYYSLFKSNLTQGQIISLILPYSIDFIAVILAARLNKNVLCVLNPSNTNFENCYILNQSKYSMLISNKEFSKKNKKFKNYFYELKRTKFKLNNNDAFIIFTSGTTSKPKGAILTDNSLKNNIKGIIKQLKFKSKDRTIIYTPPNYAMGISQVLTFIFLNSSFLLDNQGIKFTDNFLKKIKEYKITILNINIASFRYIKLFKKSFKSNNLRLVMGGGMKMTPNDANEIFNFFGNRYIANYYGCTENSPRVSHFLFSKNNLKKFNNSEILPVGKPIIGTKIFLSKINNEVKNLFEINLKGNSLMRGYLNNNLKKIPCYNTRDVGFFSKNKNLFVVGRLDNIFKSGNEKISPEEIENDIKLYLKKRTFIIIKKRHKTLNWQPALVIEGKRLFSDKNLNTKFERNLSNFKIPKKIYYMKKLFRNTYGKIDRNKIFAHISNYDNHEKN
jgi:acyl-CoA synthetase (AMP-forming)/AMP-acid ligase II